VARPAEATSAHVAATPVVILFNFNFTTELSPFDKRPANGRGRSFVIRAKLRK